MGNQEILDVATKLLGVVESSGLSEVEANDAMNIAGTFCRRMYSDREVAQRLKEDAEKKAKAEAFRIEQEKAEATLAQKPEDEKSGDAPTGKPPSVPKT